MRTPSSLSPDRTIWKNVHITRDNTMKAGKRQAKNTELTDNTAVKNLLIFFRIIQYPL